MNLIGKFFVTLKNDPREALRRTARRLLPYQVLENEKTSYEEHHRTYVDPASLESHKERYKAYAAEDLFNAPANRIRELMAQYPDVRECAVDIGSGAGWAAAELSKSFRRVVAIEPSGAAVATAQNFFRQVHIPRLNGARDLRKR